MTEEAENSGSSLAQEALLSQLPDDMRKKLAMTEVESVENGDDKPPTKKQVTSELPSYMRSEAERSVETRSFWRGPLIDKLKQNPVAFAGIGVTVFFFSRAVMSSVSGAAPSTINRNLRNRVKAQGVAIVAIALGYYLTQQGRDTRPDFYNRLPKKYQDEIDKSD